MGQPQRRPKGDAGTAAGAGGFETTMRKAKFIHDHEAFVRHLSHKVEGAGSGAPPGPHLDLATLRRPW